VVEVYASDDETTKRGYNQAFSLVSTSHPNGTKITGRP